MVALRTPTHEAFAYYVSEDYAHEDAYMLCGYSMRHARYKAETLARKPEIIARVREYRDAKLAGKPLPKPNTAVKPASKTSTPRGTPAPVMDIVDPRPYPTPSVPGGMQNSLEELTPDFNSPAVGWIRQELFRIVTEAREQGDFKAAIAGAKLMFQSVVFTNRQKPMKGAPVDVSDKFSDLDDDDEDKPQREITIQTINRLADQLPGKPGIITTPFAGDYTVVDAGDDGSDGNA